MAKKKKPKATKKSKSQSSVKKTTTSSRSTQKLVFKDPVPKMESGVYSCLFIVFILVAFALYFQCLTYGYVLDDKLAISENNFTKKGFGGIWDLLTTDTFMGYLGAENNLLQGGRYRPLSLISFAIEYQFFGLNPKVSHHINVLLYGLSGFLSFITLRRLFIEKCTDFKVVACLSFLISLVFLAHPIHTEAVANIKGRDEIMAFLFSMLTFLFSLKYFDTRKIKFLIGLPIVFFLGLLSKENTITFLAIILFGLWLFRKPDFKTIGLITGLIFTTTIVYLCVRFSIIDMFAPASTDIMNNPFVGMTAIQKNCTILFTLLLYLKLAFIPVPLTHDYYPYHIPIMNPGDWQVIASAIVYLIIVALIFFLRKKHPKISFGLFFFIAAISIVSNLVVNVGTFMNERFAFSASLGTCIILVYLVAELNHKFLPKFYPKALLGIIGLITLFYSWKTLERVPAWESELALNSEAIKVSKNSARANSFMATALFNRYKEISDSKERRELIERAQPYADRAAEILPNYKNARLMQAGIAAESYKFDRDLSKLLESFKLIIAYRPDVDYLTEYLKYLNGRGNDVLLQDFYLDIQKTLVSQNRLDWAVHYLLIAYEGAPNNTQIRGAIYDILMKQGKTADAQNFR